MKIPALPENEATRLENLEQLSILYSPAEERFDRITRITRRVFDVPIALVSLVAKEVQWFKSAQGLAANETPREVSFCGHAILEEEPLVVLDASRHPDFADNPLVADRPNIRFYAGCPLSYKGTKLGTLCVIDLVPRDFKPSDVEALKSLGGWVENELKARALSKTQIELLSKLDESQRREMIDPTTRIWSRAAIDEVLDMEFSRAKRQQTPMALLQVDVDDFEAIKSSQGDEAADEVLREVAYRVRSSVRPHDAVGRYDDHEFMVFLADCNGTDTGMIAKRIFARVADEAIDSGKGKVPVRLNIGAAAAKKTTELKLRKLKDAASVAMNEAKENSEPGVVVKADL